MSVWQKQNAAGWVFLTPATIMIVLLIFYPMIEALITSFRWGSGVRVYSQWADP
jgi:lactose/L-arabinose transport system permease protein